MRRTIKITGLFMAVMLLVSCEDFLQENPKDRYVTGNFYSSEKDASAAVTAVYQKLFPLYERQMYIMCDLTADDHKNGLGMPNQFLQDLEYLRYTSENQFVETTWQQNYNGISRANAAILNIPDIPMNDELKTRLLAEARFLRGLFYFNLVRFFGDVPLVLNVETVQDALVPRTPAAEVYAQIMEDLSFAEENLPVSYAETATGRATRGAAKILLGKVHLTRGAFREAADKLAEVIENEAEYGYGLEENYGDNWKVATENGKEMVLSVEFMEPPGGNGNNAMALCGPKYSIADGGGVPGIKGANEADIPTVDLYSQFADDDERKGVTFKLDYVSPKNNQVYTSSIPLFGKYWEEGETTAGKSDVNMYILRYADALLMYAEALNEIGQPVKALAQLNRVRERAFNDVSHNYIGLSQQQFREAVWKERRLELALEGHRWFDLVRTGRWVEVMKAHGAREAELAESNKTEIAANASDHQLLMPIPQRELDLNPQLTQNAGY